MLVRLGIFPNFRGENKKYLKPPPRWCMKGFFKWCLLSSLPMLGLQPIWSILELLSFHNHGSVVVCHYFLFDFENGFMWKSGGKTWWYFFWKSDIFFHLGKCASGFHRSGVWSRSNRHRSNDSSSRRYPGPPRVVRNSQGDGCGDNVHQPLGECGYHTTHMGKTKTHSCLSCKLSCRGFELKRKERSCKKLCTSRINVIHIWKT